MVPLSTLVTLKNISGPEYTVRFNLFRSAEVLGSLAPGVSSGQGLKAFEEVATQTLPPGDGLRLDQPLLPAEGVRGGTWWCSGLALVMVFLVLAALYESWSLPFARAAQHAHRSARRPGAGCWCASIDFDVYGRSAW